MLLRRWCLFMIGGGGGGGAWMGKGRAKKRGEGGRGKGRDAFYRSHSVGMVGWMDGTDVGETVRFWLR